MSLFPKEKRRPPASGRVRFQPMEWVQCPVCGAGHGFRVTPMTTYDGCTCCLKCAADVTFSVQCHSDRTITVRVWRGHV